MDKSNPARLAFSFQMTISDYRRMMYFNTFDRQRRQTAFLLTAWAVSLSVILLEHFAVIGPLEKITHACLMLISALIPFLVGTTEFAVWRFKHNNPGELTARRTITLTRDGVEQARDDRNDVGVEKWSDFDRIYETAALFIFYRSAKQLALLPKRAVPDELMPEVRELLTRQAMNYKD